MRYILVGISGIICFFLGKGIFNIIQYCRQFSEKIKNVDVITVVHISDDLQENYQMADFSAYEKQNVVKIDEFISSKKFAPIKEQIIQKTLLEHPELDRESIQFIFPQEGSVIKENVTLVKLKDTGQWCIW